MQNLSNLANKFPNEILTIKRIEKKSDCAYPEKYDEYSIGKYKFSCVADCNSEKVIEEMLRRINIKDETLSGNKYLEVFQYFFKSEVQNIISYKELKEAGVILINSNSFTNSSYERINTYDEFNLNEIRSYIVHEYDYRDFSEIDFTQFKYITKVCGSYLGLRVYGVKKADIGTNFETTWSTYNVK